MIPALILGVLVAQATSAGIAGVKPAFLPDVPLATVLVFGALNPVAIIVAFLMGRRADQAAKVLVAAFVGALAGAALLWLGTVMRIPAVATPGRAAAGIFVASFLFGLLWAALGYQSARRRRD
jgi:hypothetical protein